MKCPHLLFVLVYFTIMMRYDIFRLSEPVSTKSNKKSGIIGVFWAGGKSDQLQAKTLSWKSAKCNFCICIGMLNSTQNTLVALPNKLLLQNNPCQVPQSAKISKKGHQQQLAQFMSLDFSKQPKIPSPIKDKVLYACKSSIVSHTKNLLQHVKKKLMLQHVDNRLFYFVAGTHFVLATIFEMFHCLATLCRLLQHIFCYIFSINQLK